VCYNGGMNQRIAMLMERASRSLAEMAYLDGQRLCVEALALARDAEDWVLYRQILLPLQECRRQIRMAAGEGLMLIGKEGDAGFEQFEQGSVDGCLFYTGQRAGEVLGKIRQAAAEQNKNVEILVGGPNDQSGQAWRVLADWAGMTDLNVAIDPPRPAWLGDDGAKDMGGEDWLGWFICASEKMGDALLEGVAECLAEQRLDAYEAALGVVPTHERLHQALSDFVASEFL